MLLIKLFTIRGITLIDMNNVLPFVFIHVNQVQTFLYTVFIIRLSELFQLNVKEIFNLCAKRKEILSVSHAHNIILHS